MRQVLSCRCSDTDAGWLTEVTRRKALPVHPLADVGWLLPASIFGFSAGQEHPMRGQSIRCADVVRMSAIEFGSVRGTMSGPPTYAGPVALARAAGDGSADAEAAKARAVIPRTLTLI